MERLTGALTLGLIADGEQLPGESELAASLGVATVTLREALSQLRAQGLIETRRGRGGGSFASVPRGNSEARLRRRLRDMRAQQLRDLGDVALAVGGMAALRAAQRIDEQQLARLGALIDDLRAAHGAAGRRRADGRFHIELAAAAQSARLTMMELSIQAEHGDLLWLQSAGDRSEEFHAQVVREHETILAAVRAGDGEAARRAAEEHIVEGIERMLDLHFLLNEE